MVSIWIIILLAIIFLIFNYLRRSSFSEWRELHESDAVIITGCDSGIGLAVSKHLLAKLDIKLVCCFYHHGSSKGYMELAKIREQIQAEVRDIKKQRLFLHQLDITSSEEIDELVKSLDKLQAHGFIRRYFALINNAGTMCYGEFDWFTWPQIERQIEVNLTGTIRVTRAILPKLIESRGNLINVTSVCDSFHLPGISVYATTKAALSAFSDGLTYELSKFGINVIKLRLGDFAAITNIMDAHRQNSDSMWSAMNQEKRHYYRDYFARFQDFAIKNAGASGPSDYNNSSLFTDFEHLVMAKRPPRSHTIAPKWAKVAYFLLNFIPIDLYCYLLDIGMSASVGQPPGRHLES